MAKKTTEVEDTTDVLVPRVANRTVVVGVEPQVYTFNQKPLSFFGKLEVFSVIGGALDKAMSGPDGLTIGALLDGPSPVSGELTETNFKDADTFVRAIAKLVQYAPDVFSDLYLVILNVPRGDRDAVRQIISLPEDEGGLSDEDGAGILETFIDQNWEVMVDFFKSRVIPLFNKVSGKVQE